MSSELTGIAGPPRGAVAVALTGTGGAFLIDAATFAVSAMAIVGIALSGGSSQPAPAGEKTGRGLRDGLRIVTGNPYLWITIAVAGISNITLAGPIEVALPFLVRTDLRGDAASYGILLGVSAAGAVVAALLLGRARRVRRRGLSAYGRWLFAAAAVATIGLHIGLLGTAIAMLLVGGGLAVLELVWVRSLQDLVPAGALGRVSSIDAVGSYALMPVGYAAAGLATAAYGPSTVFLVGGLASFAVIALGLLHPAVRGLD